MKKGIKSWILIIPLLVFTFALQVAIIINASIISKDSNELNKLMTDCADDVNDITSLQAGSSLLSETATSFVYIACISESEDVNVTPLIGYASELQLPRRPVNILANLKARGVDNDIYELMVSAANNVTEMMNVQYQAIALVRSVYNIENKTLDVIPVYRLTDAEKALSDDAKLDRALSLLWANDYSLRKRDVSTNVNQSLSIVRSRASAKEKEINAILDFNKTLNWIFTVLIALTLLAFFFIFITYLIIPVMKFRRGIENEERLPIRGLYETRILARSYNDLFDKKTLYETELMISAETDALTGLKNRNALNKIFQQDVGPTSVVLFVFDVNNLKHINDEEGHSAGDLLIQKASNCIMKTFNLNDSFQAYRFGGDEFIAIIKNVSQADVDKLMIDFSIAQKEYDISIACGYEYVADGSDTSYSKLFKRADRNMYDDKINNHSNNEGNEL